VNFLKTLQADLRERQIFPAVIVLAVLAIAIPIAAPTLFGKVATPPPSSGVVPQVRPPAGVLSPQQARGSEHHPGHAVDRAAR
jgi:hypothetical protein